MAKADPRTIFSYLVTEHGVTAEMAAGILANIEAESNFETEAVGDGGTSGGLFQHHKERWRNLRNFASRQDRSWTDWKAQVDFAMSEAQSMNIDLATRDAAEAARQWTLIFERPANASTRARERAARVQNYMYGGTGGGSGSSADESPAARRVEPVEGEAAKPLRRFNRLTPTELPQFMEAVARTESGANYMFRSPDGSRFGAYGFRSEAWPDLAAMAGIPDADPRDPAAQDKVAGTMFAELYRRTRSWPLTAVAWMAGLDAARYVARDGFNSDTVAKLTADGESVIDYTRKVTGFMSSAPHLEVPDPNQMILAPGERPPAEDRRERLGEMGRMMLRATRAGRPPTSEPGVAAAVTQAAEVRQSHEKRPGVTATPATPTVQPETSDAEIRYE